MRLLNLAFVIVINLLLVGCVAPNQKDFIKGNISVTALASDDWKYRFLDVGTDSQPIGNECPLEMAATNKIFVLAKLTPLDVISLGGKHSRDSSPSWPEQAKPYMIENSHFVFVGDRLFEAKFYFPESDETRSTPTIRIGRIGLDRFFSFPMQEGDVVELLGPADRIRMFDNW